MPRPRSTEGGALGSWELATVAALVLAYGAVSRRLDRSPVSAAMFFTAGGLLVGPVLGLVDLDVDSGSLRALAEITLVLVLFSDASRISLRSLRRELSVPGRLLGIGLPLTIVAGTIVGALVLPGVSIAEALVLSVMLASTDAALGQAVVTDRRLPSRVRQGLNVESGLNDGLCVPLFFIAIAIAGTEDGSIGARGAVRLVAEAIGYGSIAGVLAGLAGALVVRASVRRGLGEPGWLRVATAAAAIVAFGLAEGLGGSTFIAAFVAGLVFGVVRHDEGGEVGEFVEETGGLLDAVTFVLFGAAILGPAFDALDARLAVYAALSLTVVRMVPVALALLGTGARRQTVLYLGWFGPRGLASIVFAVILLQEASLPDQNELLLAVVATVGLSILVHGVTARPLTDRYVRWFDAHPRDARPAMESAPVHAHPWRGWQTRGHE